MLYYITIFIILLYFFRNIWIPITNYKSDKKLHLEIVKSQHELEQGLMYRNTLLENHGMLFDSGKWENKSIWMKNTYIPLDIIYVDKQYQIIGIVENTVPLSPKSISIDIPSRYVIEVPAGTGKKNNYQVGNNISFIQIQNKTV